MSTRQKIGPSSLSALRLPQDFGRSIGIEKILLTVPVRKPLKDEWVRVHADSEYRRNTAILELASERTDYLVHPALLTPLAKESTIRRVTLFTAITRAETVFLWKVPLLSPGGKDCEWHRTARIAAQLAMKQWVRVTSNQKTSAYETTTAKIELEEPRWPEKCLDELMEIAFGDRIISTMDHPVLKRLGGET